MKGRIGQTHDFDNKRSDALELEAVEERVLELSQRGRNVERYVKILVASAVSTLSDVG